MAFHQKVHFSIDVEEKRKDTQDRYAIKICNADMQYREATKICNTEMRFIKTL